MVQNGQLSEKDLDILRAETELASVLLSGDHERRAMELISYAVRDLADLIDSGAEPEVTTEAARLILKPLRQASAKQPGSVFLNRSVGNLFWLGAFKSSDRVVSNLRTMSRYLEHCVAPHARQPAVPITAVMAKADSVPVRQGPKERDLILKQALRDLHQQVNGHPTAAQLQSRRAALVVAGPDTRSRVQLTTAIDEAVEHLDSDMTVDAQADRWPDLRDAMNLAIRSADREFFPRPGSQAELA